MRLVLVICLTASIILSASAGWAAREAHAISTAAISPDGQTVYFSCWGDIWAAPRDGGSLAHRLTDNVALEDRPVVSPDGELIAFLSDRFGSFDLSMMPVGGTGTRSPSTKAYNQSVVGQHTVPKKESKPR